MLYSHVIYSGDRKGVSYLKKQCLILSLLLVLVLVIPAQAQTPRINFDRAMLSFSGTTAYCYVQIRPIITRTFLQLSNCGMAVSILKHGRKTPQAV